MRCPSLVISLAGLLGLAAGVSGCGASIQAVYEGDVRFEHCMALDAQPEVKPAIRRACWVEWIHFYTYGQTRDRVGHAQIRIRQLSSVSELSDPSLSHEGPGGEPVAATQPAPSAPVGTGRPPGDAPAPGDGCAGECRNEADDCSGECTSPGCRKDCSMGFRSCVRRCG
ncbi:MAG: hypothetical protein JRI68_24610 [Deltaproteobacteria bacterium]|nr:hypothetical protein [Deltaproteobacteria bacterium]